MIEKRQTFKSQHGRKGISVSALCPTRSIRAKLGRTHVGTSAEEVEGMVRAQALLRRGLDKRWTDKLVDEAVRFALWQHEENRAGYRAVMGGTI